jgi:hypothetical protein
LWDYGVDAGLDDLAKVQDDGEQGDDQNDDEEWPDAVDASYFFGEEPIEVDGEMLDPHALHLNPVYYPDKSTIDRCALMHDAGAAQEMLLEMWNEIKLAR